MAPLVFVMLRLIRGETDRKQRGKSVIQFQLMLNCIYSRKLYPSIMYLLLGGLRRQVHVGVLRYCRTKSAIFKGLKTKVKIDFKYIRTS